MNRILANLGAVALSLVLAVTVWVIAVQDENPIITGDFASPITVSLRGLDEGLSIVGHPIDQVNLTLRAPRRVWEEPLRAQDFRVVADLAGRGPGSHDVPLVGSHPNAEVEIVAVKPASLVVSLEPITSHEVPVAVQLLGVPASGYEWRRTAVTPTQVIVTGPASVVDQVIEATVEVAISGLRASLDRRQPVTLRDGQDQAVTAVEEVEPRVVQVRVEIAQRPGYRDFSVRVPYTGTQALGYHITGITVDPGLVTLRGDASAFEQLPGYLETFPVDIDGAVDVVDTQVALNLPESLAAVGVQGVNVRIQIDPIMDSRSLNLEPVIRGLGPGLTRTVPLRSVSMLVNGPIPTLATLDNSTAQVILDLSDLGPGIHSVPLTPVVAEGLTVISLLPEAVDITIMALSTPTPTVTPSATVATVSPLASPTPTPTSKPAAPGGG